MPSFLDRLRGKPKGPQEPDLTIARSREDIAAKTAFHDATWRLGASRWDADLAAGTIGFTNDLGWVVTAPVQLVGTLNSLDGTWLWGWDHPSVAPPLRSDAEQVRVFGERYGLARLTTRHVEASEEDAWQFTALACYLAGAQGGYRGPAGSTYVFMTFGAVSIAKPD